MSEDLESLNKARTERFQKKSREESFLEEFNRYLLLKEEKEYKHHTIEHPFIFVVGLPRSGTTLISQLIANTLDIGFINNLAARFYLAPLHGIRFSKAVLGERSNTDFRSTYAKTNNLSDIHEFGYFWRYWLKKDTLKDIAKAKEQEETIDWAGLKNCLATLQHELEKGMVFKNIYGSYHMERLQQLLGKVLFVYIERDELDTACSILEARKQYYGENIDKWWSYAPPEALELAKLDYRDQIAGQVVCLKNFYSKEFEKLEPESVIRVRYASLCEDPQSLIDTVRNRASVLFDYEFGQTGQAPESFETSIHEESETKKMFRKRIKEFRTKYNVA